MPRCLSQEMSKMQGRVKDVCAVVERHTARTTSVQFKSSSTYTHESRLVNASRGGP